MLHQYFSVLIQTINMLNKRFNKVERNQIVFPLHLNCKRV